MADGQVTVLVVEDDTAIRRGLRATLTALQFEVGEATSGEEAIQRLRTTEYNLVLMDLNMPGIGGVEACRRIRREFPQMCILVVTVRDREEDKVEALDAGADDYITKPFRFGELTARMRAVLRRTRTPPRAAEEVVRIGAFELHPGARSLKKHGHEIRLTPTEFNLLALLMSHEGHPIMHAKLLSTVWGPEYGDEKEYLRTFIMQLRKKIEDDPSNPTYLRTINYLGYAFVGPEEDTSTKRQNQRGSGA